MAVGRLAERTSTHGQAASWERKRANRARRIAELEAEARRRGVSTAELAAVRHSELLAAAANRARVGLESASGWSTPSRSSSWW